MAPSPTLHRLLARLNAGVFDLPIDDLVGINTWLDYWRRLASAVVIVFVCGLRSVVPQLPLPQLIGLCVVEILLTVPYRRWLASRRALGALIYTQFIVDTALLTLGLSTLPELPNDFHFLYLLTIVPCALFSLLCGLVMATLATMAHVWLSTGTSLSTSFVTPIFIFFLVAYQSRFYGDRLAAKSREAETEARMAEALLSVARALATESTSGSLLQRMTELARELTDSTWACVVVRNPARGSYRVMGLASRSGTLDEEIRSIDLPVAGLDRALAHPSADNCIAVRSPASSPIAPEMTARFLVGPFLAAALRRGRDPLGMLLVGQDDPATAFRPATQRLVAGIAHQTVLALDNARLVDELRAASTLKSEFIGTMSHELRSPLNAIIGYTDLLRDEAAVECDPGATARGETLGRVRFYALQLLEMIQMTLDVSRLEVGRLPVVTAPTDLTPFLDGIRAGIPEYWSKPDVTVEWSIPADLPTADVDASKLVTVVRNLVHNALKFTERGRVTVQARFDYRDQSDADTVADRLTITVADTGVGIAAAQLGMVFEMFRQGDGSDTRRHGGVGLGLYIVQRLTHALGGVVRVDSVPGEGSTFTIEVPVQVPGVPRATAVG